MKKVFWAIWIFLILSAPIPTTAQNIKGRLLLDCFGNAVGLQDQITLLSGDTIRVTTRPLHWKVSETQGEFVLEKGGNLSVPGILWYQTSHPRSGLKFFWTPDRKFGKIFTPRGNFLLRSSCNRFVFSIDQEETKKINQTNKKALEECLQDLKSFKQ